MYAIVGATGTGKSELSLQLAAALEKQGKKPEIINADAMQLYRGMDIGTAKLSAAARTSFPHHMFDVLEPRAEASVSAYQKAVTTLLTEMHERGATPILVGGSGLYVNSVLYEMHFAPHDPEVRAALEASYAAAGLQPLITELQQQDPQTAAKLDLQNPRRVIRALEVWRISGKPLSAHLPESPQLLRPTTLIGISEERATLTARLDKRVEKMWQQGLLNEVAQLVKHGLREGKTASQAIGYAQALQQLDGEITAAAAIAATQQLTRRYARRQVSWFKRLPQIQWITTAASQNPEQITAIAAQHPQAAPAALDGKQTAAAAASSSPPQSTPQQTPQIKLGAPAT